MHRKESGTALISLFKIQAMKKLILFLPFLILLSCSAPDRDAIFHYSVLKALDNGVLEGNMTAGELKKHGNIGLGTFNKMDGEMVVLDGIVYRVSQDGKIKEQPDDALIPYSIVAFYKQDHLLLRTDKTDYPALKALADSLLPSPNLFYAFRITGEFEYIKCGGSDMQEKPYDKSLNQMLAARPVYEGRNVKGTLVGFWCPKYIGDINSQGFHLHFLSDDLTIGGHLMEFAASKLEIGYDIKTAYRINLPDTRLFREARFRSEAVNY